MTNQSGQGAVLFLSFLPFLLTLLAFAAAFAVALDGHTTNLFTCRLQLLAAQKQAAQSLNQLFDMNMTASKLHASYEQAKAKAAAMPENPAAQSELQAQIAMNVRFHQQQLALIRKIQLEIQVSVHQLPHQMTNRLQKALPPIGEPSGELVHTSVSEPHLSLTPIQLDDLTMQYKAPPDFSRQQKLTATWQFHLPVLLPKWLQAILGKAPTLSGTCSATVEKGVKQWSPVLSADKS